MVYPDHMKQIRDEAENGPKMTNLLVELFRKYKTYGLTDNEILNKFKDFGFA